MVAVHLTGALTGEPIVLEILGRIRGNDVDKQGFDHEKKRWEVLKSKDSGEKFLGEHKVS